MLSKPKAIKLLMNNQTITLQKLEDLINALPDLSGKSKINPSMTLIHMVNSIFIPCIQEYKNKGFDFNDTIVGSRYSAKNDKIIISAIGMVAVNILRECGYQPNQQEMAIINQS